jgi:hypothetical protein
MARTYTGGCACGAIRYEIAAEPMMAGHCQCLDCQRSAGGGHASMLMFPADAVKLKGAPKYHDTRADSGNTVSRGFCANCGSPLVGKSSGMANMMTIRVGSLDDPSGFTPQFAVYNYRGHAWDHLDPATPKFPKMPPMP